MHKELIVLRAGTLSLRALPPNEAAADRGHNYKVLLRAVLALVASNTFVLACVYDFLCVFWRGPLAKKNVLETRPVSVYGSQVSEFGIVKSCTRDSRERWTNECVPLAKSAKSLICGCERIYCDWCVCSGRRDDIRRKVSTSRGEAGTPVRVCTHEI